MRLPSRLAYIAAAKIAAWSGGRGGSARSGGGRLRRRRTVIR